MTTLQLPNVSTFAFSNGFGFKPVMFKKDNGNLAVQRMAVFRTGTFRDSMGEQFTYEDIHIRQMLANFEYLKSNKLFENVPVRDGHKSFLVSDIEGNGKVVGWHTSLTTENLQAPHEDEKYDYVFADFEFTEPDAAAKFERGTWRNRSAEIGMYRTNAEADFWPVYMGVAFVDIPAVEGLNFSSSNGASDGPKFFVMKDKEKSVGDTQPQVVGQVPAPGTQAPAQHSAPAGGGLPFDPTPHVFAVNGLQVTDYTAVQAHINVLERFRADVQEQARKDFVSGLATANKIAASQIPSTEKFAIGLSPEMFEQWKGTWEQAPAQAVFGQHGNAVTNPDNAAQQQADPKEEQYKIWHATVAQFKSAGLKVEAIKNTASYKNLIAAGQTVNL